MTIPPGFVAPDFAAPIDLARSLAVVPADAQVMGMFIIDIVKLLQEAGKPYPQTKYSALTMYPWVDFIRLAAEAAPVLYPHVSQREGIRRLGQQAWRAWGETLVGKVMFGLLDGRVDLIAAAMPRVYTKAAPASTVEVLETSSATAVLRYKNMHGWVDCYQVGLWEGIVRACEREPSVWIKSRSPVDADLYVQWR